MIRTRVEKVKEVFHAADANRLLKEGWELYQTFSHPKGYVMILVKKAPIDTTV
ncbi:hypothetical protein H9636_16205 [Ureibacillus sp. Re31]|uniref:Uncharacterized protein n=1 Tax=Ureibacillus galli TaxID=2762222 RepID=A0ABR8XG61_9BACL|nr:hypothetical protein [Ureibacillus galli]MBD8028191.1 hypothetical protein [Ureibacillus galli]